MRLPVLCLPLEVGIFCLRAFALGTPERGQSLLIPLDFEEKS